MKKKLLLISSLTLNCVLAILLLFNLFRKESEAKITSYPSVSLTSHKDSLVGAINNIKHFVNTFDSTGNKIVRSYTIAGTDMLQVLGISPESVKGASFDSCRAYLGYDANNHFKLYLTPVKNNQDMFLNFSSGKSSSRTPNNSSYVMDLIAPCPNTCDYASALYTCKMPGR
jgi:hypothetical protein